MEIFIGTSAYPSSNVSLLQEAGIRWVRQDFPFPFEDHLDGNLSPSYAKVKSEAQEWNTKGMRLMGVTPLYGIARQKPDKNGILRTTWQDQYPAWMGALGSVEFIENYRSICEFLARDLKGIVQMWQILNELDISIFAGPLNPRQACDLILAGAHGLKTGNSELIVGTNTAGSDKAYYLYGRLHALGEGLLDYCGVDGYYGTWAPGGPEDWSARIAELYALSGVKVLVNEWGYSSAGGLLSEEERRSNPYVCQYKKWYYAWDGGHTPEVQAEFVRQAFDSFYDQRDKLLGVFFYRWEDQATCWQCGAPDCPAETAWGLVTQDQTPKPAFYTFKAGAARLQS